MRFDIVTLFPDMFSSYMNQSILQRAQKADLLQIETHQLRDYATDKHRITDDKLCGGGSGMLLKPEPVFSAVEAIEKVPDCPIILMSPQGRPFTQTIATDLAQYPQLVLVCGRYEGFDERIRTHLATDELSIGDYVMTGGELGAMVIIDAVARWIPGVLGKQDAASGDSYATGLLEGAHYTQPVEFRGWEVPPILLSGHHANIAQWRREQALRRTWERRPDLLKEITLSKQDKQFLTLLANESA